MLDASGRFPVGADRRVASVSPPLDSGTAFTLRAWLPTSLAGVGPFGWFAANIVVVALYFALGLIVSWFFASYGLFPAPIWLPASLAVVAAMIGNIWLLPGIFLGSFLTNEVLFAPPLHVTAIISLTNALGPVAGALLLHRLRPERGLFTSFAGVMAFLLATTLVNPAISAFGGAVAISIGQNATLSSFYAVWVNWLLTDSGGTLYLAPAVILWLGLEQDNRWRETGWTPSQREIIVWAVIALAAFALFLTPPLKGFDIRAAFPFLLVVPISWIALRMSQRAAYTLVSLVAIVATVGTVAGYGPFQGSILANPLQLVGTLVVVLAMNVLTIVALVNERREAQIANEVKSRFLANASHELRTPLNAIIGFSQMINHEVFGPIANKRYAEYASHIQTSGEQLLALIDDLLDLSKIEAGRVEIREEDVPLKDAVTQAIELIEVQASAKSIPIRVDLKCPEAILKADKTALRQILLNLLSNAVKFTPGYGKIGVTAKLGPEGELVIDVTDTGIGIADSDLERVFSPFERARESIDGKFEGTGLGLAISRGLVALHGGTITLSSVLGQGTTATVTLPPDRVHAKSA